MKTFVDRFGRVLVPKKLRARLGFEPGAELEAVEAGDSLLLRPLAQKALLKMERGVLIFTGELSGDVKDVVRSLREERLRKLGGAR